MIPLRDSIPRQRIPLVVYALIGANAAVFLHQINLTDSQSLLFSLKHAIVPRRYFEPVWGMHYGMSPTNYWPFLTFMFLHGGWLHMIFNMWTLFIFGSTLEGRLGHVQFLAFYLACGVLSGVAHGYFNRESPLPVLGASGAIAGVIGAYAAIYPRARITLLLPIIIIPLIFTIPAVAFAGIWFAMQIAQGASEHFAPALGGGIAWWAHIGGFIAGLVLLPPMLLLSARPKPEKAAPPPARIEPPPAASPEPSTWEKGPWG